MLLTRFLTKRAKAAGSEDKPSGGKENDRGRECLKGEMIT